MLNGYASPAIMDRQLESPDVRVAIYMVDLNIQSAG
jgi:hypothetical protein